MPRNRILRRSTAALIGALAATLLLAIAPAEAASRVRKNIDDLSATELANYIYAVQKLQERSATDPTVANSYAYFAGLHDIPRLFNGACVHNDEKFIPWHRAMLFYYKEGLRAIDPPRTKDVTVPYWNWTVSATGQRYPKPFEDTGSILSRSVDGIPHNTAPSDPYFTWPFARGLTLGKPYAAFAGGPGSPGAIEAQMHNTMHNDYVGGALRSTATAGNDPIFWSFHAYIDLLWWWRQHQLQETAGCLACTLRGMPGRTATGAAGPTKVSDVIDTEGPLLGYTYQFTEPSAPLRVAAAAAPQGLSAELPVLAGMSLKKPDLVRTFPATVPAAAGAQFALHLTGIKTVTEVPYNAFVYLYPKGVRFQPQAKAFRDPYLVGQFGQWVMPHDPSAGMPAAFDYTLQVDPAAYPAIFGKPASAYQISIAIHQAPVPAAPAGAMAALRASPAALLASEAEIGGAAVAAQTSAE